jgi:streptogramin lyase
MVASPASDGGPTVTLEWASTGSPENPDMLSHIAIDPQCRLWVMDNIGDRFLIFDLDGNLLETWGSSGAGDGEFNFGNVDQYYYNGIAFALDGGFYVSDLMNRRVQQFNADRTFVRAWSVDDGDAADYAALSWIAVGPDGNVYVTVVAKEDIVRVYSPEGTFIRAFASTGNAPGELRRVGPIAFDPAGNLWMVDPDSRRLLQFSPAGENLAVVPPLEPSDYPMGLAIDDNGRFYVADFYANHVAVFAPDGTFLYSWGELGVSDGKFLDPFGIELDGAGGVYVTEGSTPRIQKFHVGP